MIEAAHIDSAWRSAANAARAPRLQLTRDAWRQLGQARLRKAPGWSIITQTYPLLDLKKRLDEFSCELPLAPGQRLELVEHWSLFRADQGIGQFKLTALQARFFDSLWREPVALALQTLEHSASEAEQGNLPALVEAWLRQSLALGLWAALDP